MSTFISYLYCYQICSGFLVFSRATSRCSRSFDNNKGPGGATGLVRIKELLVQTKRQSRDGIIVIRHSTLSQLFVDSSGDEAGTLITSKRTLQWTQMRNVRKLLENIWKSWKSKGTLNFMCWLKVASMTVKNSKETPSVLGVDDMGILHARSPSIHLCKTNSKSCATNSPRKFHSNYLSWCWSMKNKERRERNIWSNPALGSI